MNWEPGSGETSAKEGQYLKNSGSWILTIFWLYFDSILTLTIFWVWAALGGHPGDSPFQLTHCNTLAEWLAILGLHLQRGSDQSLSLFVTMSFMPSITSSLLSHLQRKEYSVLELPHWLGLQACTGIISLQTNSPAGWAGEGRSRRQKDSQMTCPVSSARRWGSKDWKAVFCLYAQPSFDSSKLLTASSCTLARKWVRTSGFETR